MTFSIESIDGRHYAVDERGQIRVAIGSEADRPVITLNDEEGRPVAGIAYAQIAGQAVPVVILHQPDNAKVCIRLEDGEPRVMMFDPQDRPCSADLKAVANVGMSNN